MRTAILLDPSHRIPPPKESMKLFLENRRLKRAYLFYRNSLWLLGDKPPTCSCRGNDSPGRRAITSGAGAGLAWHQPPACSLLVYTEQLLPTWLFPKIGVPGEPGVGLLG
jgi:hypothetical protein